jgi:hypothetical protein
VGHGLEPQIPGLALLAHDDVVGLVGPHGHALVRQVRHRQQGSIEVGLGLLQALLEGADAVPYLAHLGDQRLPLGLIFELANLFGDAIALGPEGFDLGENLAPLYV